jgi:tetratricopeptide (TPR) repeat protein
MTSSDDIPGRFQKAVELHLLGRLADADFLYRAVLAEVPLHTGALQMLSAIHHQKGEPAAALALLERIIALNPGDAAAHVNRGIALSALERLKEALASYDRAIALKSDYAQAYFGRGVMLQALERHTEALASYDRALALKGDHAATHFNRGTALLDLERPDEALASYDLALALEPNYVKAHINRGVSLCALKRYEEALASCEKAIALKPDYAEAHNNCATALNELKRCEEALARCHTAIALKPDYAEAYNNRGSALGGLKRYDEALASYDKAIALRADCADAHVNRGILLMLLGRYEEGFPEYEFRPTSPNRRTTPSSVKPVWLGRESIAGKTLLIREEQGIGDMLQFCRYAKTAESLGAKVMLSARPALHRLLKQLGPAITIVSENDEPPSFDYQCRLMSLPLAFKTTLSGLVPIAPYLSAEAERIRKWRAILGDDGFKIGICWQGRMLPYAPLLDRSCALSEFSFLARIPGVRLISLQKASETETLRDVRAGMKVEILGPEFDAGPDAFLDTAAVMETLDLVISVDSAIAHLAGALARPTWVLLKYVSDWRWLIERSDSPWYPTMRLFRQTQPGDWRSAFAAVETALTESVRQKPRAI